MSSIVEHAYPRIKWEGRTKKLWNPVHKKTLKNLPEERVRLRVIEYLLQSGWSKNRISTEEGVGKIGDTAMRTDIICYSRQFNPRLLVECKAEQVAISAKTAEQVARYNQKVEAPYILMTNGVSDYWYGIDEDSQKVVRRKGVPGFLAEGVGEADYGFEYWQGRGFAGAKSTQEMKEWFVEILPGLMFPEDSGAIRFLDFGEGPSDVNLSHYYRIISVDEDRRLALTTLNTAYGDSRMIVILNRKNENRAALEINLDLLFEEKEGNSALYSREGIRTFDLSEYLSLRGTADTDSIVEQADRLFSNYVD